jgi:hypothetical protein
LKWLRHKAWWKHGLYEAPDFGTCWRIEHYGTHDSSERRLGSQFTARVAHRTVMIWPKPSSANLIIGFASHMMLRISVSSSFQLAVKTLYEVWFLRMRMCEGWESQKEITNRNPSYHENTDFRREQ